MILLCGAALKRWQNLPDGWRYWPELDGKHLHAFRGPSEVRQRIHED